jgi:hypothetical protein
VSQNNSFSRQIEDLMMETTEQVVIPDPEVVPERAHSSKFSGKVLQVFQRTKVRPHVSASLVSRVAEI